MFTDESTPTRVELLLDVVRSMSDRKLDASVIKQLLQPVGLPGLTAASDQASRTLIAARELELVHEQPDGMIRATQSRDARSPRRAVVDPVDEKILADDKVEPWFAMFYAFLLGLDESAAAGAGGEWEARFENEVFGGQTQPDRFNATKYRGLRRWFRYSGLGWHDSEDRFHPNPYDRLARRLPVLFRKQLELSIDDFMHRLSEFCPELDGGHLFLKANTGWDRAGRSLSQGLSHALVDLHADGLLILNCPLDSDGWSLAKAAPPRDGENMKSDRVSSVRLGASEAGLARG
jgi:hypothetical protein